MIWVYPEVSEKQLLAARMVATTVWFDRHKNRINVFERLWIRGLQNPTLFTHVVFIENAKTASLLLVRSSAAPRLKGTRVLDSRLRLQIERIEDQRFSLGVEDPAVRFGRPCSGNIANIRHVELASTHQFANVAVPLEQLLPLGNFRVLLVEGLFAV